jgi:hypothetical protein
MFRPFHSAEPWRHHLSWRLFPQQVLGCCYRDCPASQVLPRGKVSRQPARFAFPPVSAAAPDRPLRTLSPE